MKPYASYKASGVPWLGDVPSHWIPKRLKHMGQFRAGAGFPIEEQGQSGNLLPFFKVRDIDGSNQGGVITTTDSTVSVETANRLGARVFPKNSIVFAKVGAALLLNRFRLLGVDACIDNNMMGYMVDADEASPEFMYWAMQRINFSEIVNPGTVPSLNEPLISNLFMASPPPDEQQAIANYLDAETARIDTLIHEKDELTGFLKEWRQSVIAEVVTKGLDKTAATKPSGVQWLGDVPVNWVEAQIRHVTSRVTDGAHVSPDTSSPDMPFVSTVDIKNEKIDFENCLGTTSASYEIMKRTGCKPLKGDVLFSKDGTIGRTCVVDYEREFVVASSLVIISPEIDEIESRYLSYWLNSSLLKQNYELLLAGAALRRISIEKVSRLPVFLPTISEQKAIADYLDAETAKIDDLITHTHDEITLLKELRAATIADAVLGRVDVRTKT